MFLKDIDLSIKTWSFHLKIIRFAEIYKWIAPLGGVLGLAIYLHNVYSVNSDASWLIPDNKRDIQCPLKAPAALLAPRGRPQGLKSAFKPPGETICCSFQSGKCLTLCR